MNKSGLNLIMLFWGLLLLFFLLKCGILDIVTKRFYAFQDNFQVIKE